LHVDQGSEITVRVSNDGDVAATVHWHGLRLENRYDGVPHETQEPIPVGGTFTYKLQLPDAGFYWYHPHIREDFAQEMGLYGTIVVEPSDAAYWPQVDRYLTLTLDDLLVEDGHVAPFRKSGPNFNAMGRFGNVMLINGETTFSGEAVVGEVVRLYLVNTANTRIFNFAVSGARTKLVGGDSGRYEHETFVDEILLAPSERAVVDVLFETPGSVRLEHRTPDRTRCAPSARQGAGVCVFDAASVRARCSSGGAVRLPHAPRGHGYSTREVPEVRDEAGAIRYRPSSATRGAQRAGIGRQPRMGRSDARHQPRI
jgi:FtsP/CotA-like multicopper oxidase with cupredoxin domain